MASPDRRQWAAHTEPPVDNRVLHLLEQVAQEVLPLAGVGSPVDSLDRVSVRVEVAAGLLLAS